MSSPHQRTSKNYRLRDDVTAKLRAVAKADNRTENNMLETLLEWALAKPDLLARMKAERKPMTLGELLSGVLETGKEMHDDKR